MFIYLICDSVNRPQYIGKTNNLAKRFYAHCRRGEWAYSITVIEKVKDDDRWQDRERFWIAYYSRWYTLKNIAKGGQGGSGPRSAETKLKLSIAHTGMVKPWARNPKSTRTKELLSIANTGKKQSAETVDKRRAKLIGREITWRKALSIAGQGRKHTTEQVAANRARQKGIKRCPVCGRRHEPICIPSL